MERTDKSRLLNRIKGQLLREHLEPRVAGAMVSGDAADGDQKAVGLVELIDRLRS